MPAPQTPEQFAASLLRAAQRAPGETVKVVRRGLQNVKAEGRRNSVRSSGFSAAGAPYQIEYDGPNASGVTVWGEVGYRGRGQGNLGAVLEYGGGEDPSPPHLDLGRALESEDGRFTEAMRDMAERVLE